MLADSNVALVDPNAPIFSAFRARKSAAIASFLFLAILFSPVWLWYFIEPEDAYKSIQARMGNYNYQAEEIFAKNDPVDILFLGSSTMWTSIDHKVFQKSWLDATGNKINSLTLGGNWRGEDALYLQLRDMLKNRPVKQVVFSIPNSASKRPHPAAKYIWNIKDDFHTFWSLPFKMKLQVYSENLLIAPRLLWTLASKPKDKMNDRNLNQNNGSLVYKRGFKAPGKKKHEKFESLINSTANINIKAAVFSGVDTDYFKVIKSRKYNDFEAYFMNKIKMLCAEFNVELVYLKLPRPDKEKQILYVRKPLFSPAIDVIGIPIEAMLPNKEQSYINAHFYNVTHPNQNGAKLISQSLAPVLANYVEKKKKV
ncbi:hypothetical protein KO527_20575 [Pseudoalteromonas sp. C2R02]|uniref:hypothetical protein n=1 Tax=Pseudoalteromonas sp. C2R02 TaxID=2841565 RepID=UPI001C09CA8F|nr:hypothetical protein [Pseudoalteromonas sp. C2R02]MBU2971749.1 hypothetical protein [Pseudoalteromonas sp. C2R02]